MHLLRDATETGLVLGIKFIIISIHASLTRCNADSSCSCLLVSFQFMHLLRDATNDMKPADKKFLISIHASLTRCNIVALKLVSIHALNFNSCISYEMQLGGCGGSWSGWNFNSCISYEMQLGECHYFTHYVYFNSCISYEMQRLILDRWQILHIFQFMHLLRDATFLG